MQRSLSPFRLAVAVAVALGGVVIAWARWGAAEEPAPPTAQATVPSAGMVIYIDPATGKPGTPPPGAIVSPPGAVSPRSGGQWRQSPDPTPGGGWKLEGRQVLSTMTATEGPDGKVTVDCVPETHGEKR